MHLLVVILTYNIDPSPQHPEDVVEVRSVRLIESESLVDEDDEVADVLEDKDTVSLHHTL